MTKLVFKEEIIMICYANYVIPYAFRDIGTEQIVWYKGFIHINLTYRHYGKVSL